MSFYWFEFEDGYRCCVAGMSKQELKVEERKHGKLLRKVEAWCVVDTRTPKNDEVRE